jgi:hypothetical protein
MLSSQSSYAPNGNNYRRYSAALLLAIASLMTACGGAENAGGSAASVSLNRAGLAWDPVTDPNVRGYRVYYGTGPGAYLQPPGQGLNASATAYAVTNLQPGTYYFAVTAYDISNIESGFSNEVSKNIP